MGFRKKNSKRLKGKWGIKGRESQQQELETGGGDDGAGGDGLDLGPEVSSQVRRDAGLPVVRMQADAQGVVTLEVRHNTMVIMEAGVQDWWEHRIFKPSIVQLSGLPLKADTASGQQHGGEEGPGDGEHARARREGGEGGEEGSGAGADALVEPRINLTFHVHVSS